MKRIILATVTTLTFGIISLNKEKTAKLSDNSVVKYNVDDNGKKAGAFVISSAKGITLLRGSYLNDVRTGDWYCFDKTGQVLLRYNYSLKKLVALDNKQISDFEFKVLDNNEDVTKNARIPVPICSIEQFKSLFISELINQIPPKLKSAKANFQAEVTILINEKGDAKYIAKYIVEGYEYKTSLDLDNKIFKVEWLPAVYNDKAYKAEVKFNVNFSIDPSDQKRFIWNY